MDNNTDIPTFEEWFIKHWQPSDPHHLKHLKDSGQITPGTEKIIREFLQEEYEECIRIMIENKNAEPE